MLQGTLFHKGKNQGFLLKGAAREPNLVGEVMVTASLLNLSNGQGFLLLLLLFLFSFSDISQRSLPPVLLNPQIFSIDDHPLARSSGFVTTRLNLAVYS